MDELSPNQLPIGDAIAAEAHGAQPEPSHGRAFGALLESLREARQLSKADLAKRADVDPSTITRFEQGKRAPERVTILALAAAMTLPGADRDRLLAAAGFRSELWDDPLFVELVELMHEPGVTEQARREARSVVRMVIAYLKLQRLRG